MFLDFLFLLLLAVINVAVFRRLALPPVLAYLFTGVILGPAGFALFSGFHDIELIAELGIVFLMFSLGLEFSLPKMMAMRKLVLGLGGAQVFVTSMVFFSAGLYLGMSWQEAIVLSGVLTMSSTAIIIKQLTEQQKIHTRRGQLAVSVLLCQDVAVVPLLIVVPIFATQGVDSAALGSALFYALAKGLLAVVLILAIGKWVLPPVFQEIASAQSDELFVLTTLLVALLAAGFTQMLGLSMALGAFLAGMMLGESHYKHQLESDIRPFRDILMGLFFITIGMLIDLSVLLDNWVQLIGMVVCIMFIKAAIISALAFGIKERTTDAISSGLMLSQVGEFGFVLVALATNYKLMNAEVASLVVAAGVISMAVTPALVKYSHKITIDLLHGSARLIKKRKPLPGQYQNHVIICGFGRVGQTIARFLKAERINYIALDRDPIRINESVAGGETVAFGDACRREILLMAGIDKARLVIITFDNRQKSLQMLGLVRSLNANARVLVRTKDDTNLTEFREQGAAEVVPEILEGSLMLVSHVLLMSGVPISKVIKKMQRERNNQYRHLHGFFHGQTSENKSTPHMSDQLHAVTLEAGDVLIGKRFVSFRLPGVELREVRRQQEELLQNESTRKGSFQEGDVLLICGKAEVIERAETFIHEGH